MAITVQAQQADGSWGVRNAFVTENKKVLAGSMKKDDLLAQARKMMAQWQATYPDKPLRVHDDSIPERIASNECEKCGCELNGEAAHIEARGEVWCHSCADNAAEDAYERFCADFHDGGNTSFKSLQQQQIEARRLK